MLLRCRPPAASGRSGRQLLLRSYCRTAVSAGCFQIPTSNWSRKPNKNQQHAKQHHLHGYGASLPVCFLTCQSRRSAVCAPFGFFPVAFGTIGIQQKGFSFTSFFMACRSLQFVAKSNIIFSVQLLFNQRSSLLRFTCRSRLRLAVLSRWYS